jgi:hypothetical protein
MLKTLWRLLRGHDEKVMAEHMPPESERVDIQAARARLDQAFGDFHDTVAGVVLRNQVRAPNAKHR